MKKLLKKLKKTITSTCLCIKYPFLYPRNRFTGLHYTNWKIHNFLCTWSPLTTDTFILTPNTVKTPWTSTVVAKDSRRYTIFVRDGKVTICNLNKILWERPIEYFGTGEIKGVTQDSEKRIYLVTSEDFNKDPNNSWIINVTHAKWLNNICKILSWIHRKPLQWIHCLTSYTELDAMPEGWRKAFGLQMCDEIKEALIKNNYLKQYRIIQIKEKFGTLRWYDAAAPEEVYRIIDKYEDISEKTCIVCGKPATYISTGWISPYCDEHIENKETATKI